MNDPIPDTVVDPATGEVVSPSAEGPSALLDKFTITKPDLEDHLTAQLRAPETATAGSMIRLSIRIHNLSTYALNGVQVVVKLPHGAGFAGTLSDKLTVHGSEVVVTLGCLEPHSEQTVEVSETLASDLPKGAKVENRALIRSSTALAAESNETGTRIAE